MPDLGELLLLILVGAGIGMLIGGPLLRGRGADPRDPAVAGAPAGEREALEIRHRVALDALRDLELDRRAGSVDEAGYAEQRAAAERRAEETLAELDSAQAPSEASPRRISRFARRVVAAGAGFIAVALLVAFALPAPVGIANPTQTNQVLADQIGQEAARQSRIRALLAKLSTNPRDTQTLSDLADAYLEGGTATDLSRGATVLLALIGLEPDDVSAYQRLITAYVNAGDWTNAGAATESYARVAPGSADIPFFRGLIALRGRNDPAAAAAQFRAFLAAAPDDARAPMIRALLTEAEASLPSPSPGG